MIECKLNLTLKKSKVIIFLLIGGINLFLPAVAFADLTVDEAMAKVKTFLQMPRLQLRQEFGIQSDAQGKTKGYYNFVGPPGEDISVGVDASSGVIRYFVWYRQFSSSQKVVLSLDLARKKADEFLNHSAQNQIVGLKPIEAQFIDHGAGGKIYEFAWGKEINDIFYPFRLHISVSAQTGDIVDYGLADYPVTLSSLQPAITKQQAIALITPKIELQTGWKVEDIHLVIPTPIKGSNPNLEWRIRITGWKLSEYDPIKGQIKYSAMTEYFVDAMTGALLSSQTGSIRPLKVVQIRPPAPRPLAHDRTKPKK